MDSLRSLYILFLIASLASCQAILPNPKSPVHNEVAAFIDDLEKNPSPGGIEKTTIRNGESKKLILRKPNLGHELALFRKAILSESYLNSYYTRDSGRYSGDGDAWILTYSAIGEKPEVQKLQLWKENGQIVQMAFEAVQDNYLYRNNVRGTLLREGPTSREKHFSSYSLDIFQVMLFEDGYSVKINAQSL